MLVEEGFLYLGRELGEVARGEATPVAVGEVVAFGPGGVVEVGDVVAGGRGAAGVEGGYLLDVTHEEEVGGRREFVGGIGVEAFDVGSDVGGSGAHAALAGVGDGDEHALALFPLDEGVKRSPEAAVRHDEVVQRGVATDGLAGGVGLQDVVPHGEVGRVVAKVHPLGGGEVGIVVLKGDGHGGDEEHFARDGVVGQGGYAQAGEVAVARHTDFLDGGRGQLVVAIGGIEGAVDDEGEWCAVGLGGDRLYGHEGVFEIVQLPKAHVGHFYGHFAAQGYLYQFGEYRKVGGSQRGGGYGPREGDHGVGLALHFLDVHGGFGGGVGEGGSGVVCGYH